MLTVWRKLHIEFDSMGQVSGNYATGQIINAHKLGSGSQTLDLSVSNLEPNRFENGRLVITRTNAAGITAQIGDRRITSNTASSVTFINNLRLSVQNGDNFTLYDDDDMDNLDGTNLHGDIGEDVPMLDRTYLEDSDDPNLNHFVPAYIIPKYDVGNNNNSVTFVLNTATDDNQGIRNLFEFNQIATEANQNFWTVYLLSAYQHTTDQDEDPESEFQDTTVGIADGANVNGIWRGQGAVVFLEANGPKECPSTSTQPPLPPEFCNIDSTKVHEIGHRLGADHGQGGVMDDLTTNFSSVSIAVIRNFDYP